MTSIVLILIVVNVFLYFLPFLVNFGGSTGNSFLSFLSLGWKSNQAIADGEYYRLITSTFLHGSFMHLFVNMYSLYVVGPDVSRIFGNFGFGLIYILSGIGGSLASFWFNPNPSVGASGSIFGLLGALIVFSVFTQNFDLLSRLIVIAIVNLLIGISPGSNIDNFGHVGGLITGFVVAFVIYSVYGFAIFK